MASIAPRIVSINVQDSKGARHEVAMVHHSSTQGGYEYTQPTPIAVDGYINVGKLCTIAVTAPSLNRQGKGKQAKADKNGPVTVIPPASALDLKATIREVLGEFIAEAKAAQATPPKPAKATK